MMLGLPNPTALPFKPDSPTATAWRTVYRHPSGHYIQTLGGSPLARVGDRGIYFWDKAQRQEVFISFDALINLAS